MEIYRNFVNKEHNSLRNKWLSLERSHFSEFYGKITIEGKFSKKLQNRGNGSNWVEISKKEQKYVKVTRKISKTEQKRAERAHIHTTIEMPSKPIKSEQNSINQLARVQQKVFKSGKCKKIKWKWFSWWNYFRKWSECRKTWKNQIKLNQGKLYKHKLI